jgi:ABC-type branched-subunit amino acid transport system permease subunit
MSQDKIGVDQWVEQYGQRVGRGNVLTAFIDGNSKRLPVWGWLIVMVAVCALLPLLTSNTFAIRVAGNIALLGTLALGLNVVVGYAGLLDLGFVAFYGIGAYAYAYLSSDFSGVHLPTWLSLIIVVVISALFGLLLGSPSLRLIGDYLAIVTLGFGQIFVQLVTSLTRVNLPGREKAVDLTGGPNGIPNLDPIRILGFEASTVVHYYLILLVLLALVVLVIYHLHQSRVGRAWRALREDELAAEAMGMPTRRLKLQAFAVGAGIAGLCGALFASWQGSVFPSNFDTTLLITVYAIIVLGGLGSLPGVLVGAVIMIAAPDILRNAELAGSLFYIGVLITLFAALKPRWHMLTLLVAVAVFGVILRALLVEANPGAFEAFEAGGSVLTDTIRRWLVIPVEATLIGNYAFGLLIIMVLVVSRLKQPITRLVALVPTIYVLLFVWETRLSQEPSVTRLLFVGALLIVLMIYRPNGLLGQRRVEI